MEAPSPLDFLERWSVEPVSAAPADGVFAYRIPDADGDLSFSFNLLDGSLDIRDGDRGRVTVEGVARCFFDEREVLRAEGVVGRCAVTLELHCKPTPRYSVAVLRVA